MRLFGNLVLPVEGGRLPRKTSTNKKRENHRTAFGSVPPRVGTGPWARNSPLGGFAQKPHDFSRGGVFTPSPGRPIAEVDRNRHRGSGRARMLAAVTTPPTGSRGPGRRPPCLVEGKGCLPQHRASSPPAGRGSRAWSCRSRCRGAILVFVVPVPPGVLDLLLSANVTLAVLVLLTTLAIRSPQDFSAFPTILLTTTLTRLVLNVATVRLILTRGRPRPRGGRRRDPGVRRVRRGRPGGCRVSGLHDPGRHPFRRDHQGCYPHQRGGRGFTSNACRVTRWRSTQTSTPV